MEILVCVFCTLFICGFVYWTTATVIKNWLETYNREIDTLNDNLSTINKNIDSLKIAFAKVDNTSKRNAEMIGFRLFKLSEKMDTLKDGVEKVADNIASESEENDEPEITYDQMMQNYYGSRSEEYKFQVSRLKKQIELLETDYENLHKKYKVIEDENRSLKLEMQVKSVDALDTFDNKVVGMTDENTVVEG